MSDGRLGGRSGLLAGLVAALLMGLLLLLLLRSVAGIPTPAEALPDRFVPLLGVRLFFSLLGLVGGYDQLKQLGVGSVLAGQLLVGALIGLAYAARGSTGGRRDFVFVGVAVGLLWLGTLGLLWPVLGTSYRGLPPGQAALATALGLLLAYASYGGALIALYRALTRPLTIPELADEQRTGRRRGLLVVGLGGALALVSGGLLRRLWDLATFAYDGTKYLGPDILPIAPNDRFYVVTKNVVDPAVDRSAWRLEVGGLVDRPRSYRFEELAALPSVTQETTLMCISNPVGDGLMSNAVWKGIPLRALLVEAWPQPGAVEVLLRGSDGYTDTFSLDKALDPATLVVWEMNGEPLPERHGYPVRVVVPGLFGEKNVKWVTRIEVVDHDAKGFYEQQGWGPSFEIPTRSGFIAPDFGQPMRVGEPVRLRGTAFAGDRGVARVEVSVDAGQCWSEARLDHPGTPLTWAFWSYEWRPVAPGEHQLVVRALDGRGVLQSSEVRDVAPQGATGYHRVVARVVV